MNSQLESTFVPASGGAGGRVGFAEQVQLDEEFLFDLASSSDGVDVPQGEIARAAKRVEARYAAQALKTYAGELTGFQSLDQNSVAGEVLAFIAPLWDDALTDFHDRRAWGGDCVRRAKNMSGPGWAAWELKYPGSTVVAKEVLSKVRQSSGSQYYSFLAKEFFAAYADTQERSAHGVRGSLFEGGVGVVNMQQVMQRMASNERSASATVRALQSHGFIRTSSFSSAYAANQDAKGAGIQQKRTQQILGSVCEDIFLGAVNTEEVKVLIFDAAKSGCYTTGRYSELWERLGDFKVEHTRNGDVIFPALSPPAVQMLMGLRVPAITDWTRVTEAFNDYERRGENGRFVIDLPKLLGRVEEILVNMENYPIDPKASLGMPTTFAVGQLPREEKLVIHRSYVKLFTDHIRAMSYPTKAQMDANTATTCGLLNATGDSAFCNEVSRLYKRWLATEPVLGALEGKVKYDNYKVTSWQEESTTLKNGTTVSAMLPALKKPPRIYFATSAASRMITSPASMAMKVAMNSLPNLFAWYRGSDGRLVVRPRANVPSSCPPVALGLSPFQSGFEALHKVMLTYLVKGSLLMSDTERVSGRDVQAPDLTLDDIQAICGGVDPIIIETAFLKGDFPFRLISYVPVVAGDDSLVYMNFAGTDQLKFAPSGGTGGVSNADAPVSSYAKTYAIGFDARSCDASQLQGWSQFVRASLLPVKGLTEAAIQNRYAPGATGLLVGLTDITISQIHTPTAVLFDDNVAHKVAGAHSGARLISESNSVVAQYSIARIMQLFELSLLQLFAATMRQQNTVDGGHTLANWLASFDQEAFEALLSDMFADCCARYQRETSMKFEVEALGPIYGIRRIGQDLAKVDRSKIVDLLGIELWDPPQVDKARDKGTVLPQEGGDGYVHNVPFLGREFRWAVATTGVVGIVAPLCLQRALRKFLWVKQASAAEDEDVPSLQGCAKVVSGYLDVFFAHKILHPFIATCMQRSGPGATVGSLEELLPPDTFIGASDTLIRNLWQPATVVDWHMSLISRLPVEVQQSAHFATGMTESTDMLSELTEGATPLSVGDRFFASTPTAANPSGGGFTPTHVRVLPPSSQELHQDLGGAQPLSSVLDKPLTILPVTAPLQSLGEQAVMSYVGALRGRTYDTTQGPLPALPPPVTKGGVVVLPVPKIPTSKGETQGMLVQGGGRHVVGLLNPQSGISEKIRPDGAQRPQYPFVTGNLPRTNFRPDGETLTFKPYVLNTLAEKVEDGGAWAAVLAFVKEKAESKPPKLGELRAIFGLPDVKCDTCVCNRGGGASSSSTGGPHKGTQLSQCPLRDNTDLLAALGRLKKLLPALALWLAICEFEEGNPAPNAPTIVPASSSSTRKPLVMLGKDRELTPEMLTVARNSFGLDPKYVEGYLKVLFCSALNPKVPLAGTVMADGVRHAVTSPASLETIKAITAALDTGMTAGSSSKSDLSVSTGRYAPVSATADHNWTLYGVKAYMPRGRVGSSKFTDVEVVLSVPQYDPHVHTFGKEKKQLSYLARSSKVIFGLNMDAVVLGVQAVLFDRELSLVQRAYDPVTVDFATYSKDNRTHGATVGAPLPAKPTIAKSADKAPRLRAKHEEGTFTGKARRNYREGLNRRDDDHDEYDVSEEARFEDAPDASVQDDDAGGPDDYEADLLDRDGYGFRVDS